MLKKSLNTVNEVLSERKLDYIFLYMLGLIVALLEILGIGLVFPVLYVLLGISTGIEGMPEYVNRVLVELAGLEMWQLAVLLVIVFALKNILRFGADYGNAVITARIRGFWMKLVFRRYLDSHYLFFVKHKHGELAYNIFDLTYQAMVALRQLVAVFMTGIMTVLVLVALFSLQWQLTFVVLIFASLVYLMINKPLLNRVSGLGKKLLKRYQYLGALPVDVFRNIRDVKVYSLTERLRQRHSSFVDETVKLQKKVSFYELLPTVFPEILLMFLLGAALVWSEYRYEGQITQLVPIMATYAYALFRLLYNGGILLKRLVVLSSAWPSVVHLQAVLMEQAYNDVLEGGHPVPGGEWILSVESVSYGYQEGPQAVAGLSVSIKPGELVAIVGDSGSGKTTLVNLLLRLLDPVSGRITYKGIDIRRFSLAAWRDIIGFVGQDTFLMHGSIQENIGLAERGNMGKSVAEAAQLAGADEFISRMPNGFKTIVGEGGSRLSGGQRQRIAIARALVRKPNIFIFDEPTSALDAKTEHQILATIKSLAKSAIVILVTHRLSAAQEADRVLVMKNGRLVESGQPGELWAQKKGYWELFNGLS